MLSLEKTYNVSFRCFFNGDPSRYSTHFQRDFPVKEIAVWLDAYKFTHPDCSSISVKVWLTGNAMDADDEKGD